VGVVRVSGKGESLSLSLSFLEGSSRPASLISKTKIWLTSPSPPSLCSHPSLSAPHRQDCTLIPNARNVACNAGKCTVESCKEGFVIGRDGKSCVRRGMARR
jgi:hypothetical protein